MKKISAFLGPTNTGKTFSAIKIYSLQQWCNRISVADYWQEKTMN